MTGWIAIVGLGPGREDLVTPEVTAALAQATDVIGYTPYVARVAPRDGLTLHPSDNRVELDRAAHALHLASQGARVVVVSSGDPGVFAMAFYNPRSKSRPHQFAAALEILREECGADRLITFARAVSTPEQALRTVTLGEATPEMADMRTVVLVGNSATRRVGRYIYTPRSAQ